jgi:hypothetical protein
VEADTNRYKHIWIKKRKKTSAENSENLSQYSGKRGETGWEIRKYPNLRKEGFIRVLYTLQPINRN